MWLNEDKTRFGFVHNDLEIEGELYNNFQGKITFDVKVSGGYFTFETKLEYQNTDNLEKYLIDDIKKTMRDISLMAF